MDPLIDALADGRFHSGEALARAAGVTRSAIWKRVAQLAALGIDVQRVSGRGYRISGGLDLLDADVVRAAVGTDAARLIERLEVHRSIDSTNTQLMERGGPARCAVCLAEHQSGGRGRMGRRWVSPFAANLYASVAWTFAALPAGVQALSLAAGAAVAGALDPDRGLGIELKWPNDIVVGPRKLGGVLVELRGEPPGSTRAVVGVGVNVRMPPEAASAIDQPWTDLASLGPPPARNILAAAVVAALVAMFERFERDGFAASLAPWTARDALRDRRVRVHAADGDQFGVARGIDRDGALRLEVEGQMRRVISGEISVREER